MPADSEYHCQLRTTEGHLLQFRIALRPPHCHGHLLLGNALHVEYNSKSGQSVPVPHIVHYRDGSKEFSWGNLGVCLTPECARELAMDFVERRHQNGNLCTYLPWLLPEPVQ